MIRRHRDEVVDVFLCGAATVYDDAERALRRGGAAYEASRRGVHIISGCNLLFISSCSARDMENWISVYDAAPPSGREVLIAFFHISSGR